MRSEFPYLWRNRGQGKLNANNMKVYTENDLLTYGKFLLEHYTVSRKVSDPDPLFLNDWKIKNNLFGENLPEQEFVVADNPEKSSRKLPVKCYDFMTYLWYFFEDKYLWAYKDREAFTEHYNSGNVHVSFADIERLYRDYQEQKPVVPPSRFQRDDKVNVSFNGYLNNGKETILEARVLNVHFYHDKVKYDLEIPIYDEPPTRIYNVDSNFVNPIEVQKEINLGNDDNCDGCESSGSISVNDSNSTGRYEGENDGQWPCS